MALSCFSPAFVDSLQGSFSHCYLLAMLCNEWSIATNKADGHFTFQYVFNIWAHITTFLWFSPALIGLMSKEYLFFCVGTEKFIPTQKKKVVWAHFLL